MRWYLLPYLRSEKVLRVEAQDPDGLEIHTVWPNGNTEYIAALRQVIDNLPGDDAGALRADDEGIMWDEVPIASFTDMPLKRGDFEKGLGAFVEYAADRLERSLLRAIVLESLDLIMRAGVDTATTQILDPRTAAIDAPKGRLIIRVDGGTGRVTRLGIEVDPYVTAEIASYGVHYSSLMDYRKTIDEVTGR